MIEEASRERFIYAYRENSSYSTVDFVQRAIVYFGYAPDMIQTDNGGECTHTAKTKRIHPLDALCSRLHIEHKTIRPATPWHNGKVERSHRNDQERFYNHLSFYSYEDLQLQMKRYLRRSNRIPMSCPFRDRSHRYKSGRSWRPPGFADLCTLVLFPFLWSHIIGK